MWVTSSVMTAANVTSLPVPAVVGIAISGGSLCHTLRIPFILERSRFGLTALAPIALAESIADPPPIAIIA